MVVISVPCLFKYSINSLTFLISFSFSSLKSIGKETRLYPSWRTSLNESAVFSKATPNSTSASYGESIVSSESNFPLSLASSKKTICVSSVLTKSVVLLVVADLTVYCPSGKAKSSINSAGFR